MIYCPNCGTANRDGSSLCSECGEELGPPPAEETAAHTPEAEEEMPAWLRTLGATGPAAGQPDELESQDEELEIPDWLRDLRASLPEEPEEEQDRAGEEEPGSPSEAQEEVSDWLAELRSFGADREPQVDIEGREEQPRDRMAEYPQAAGEEAEPDFGGEEEEAPDWLDALRRSAPDEGIEPFVEPEEEEAPDWLDSLRRSAPEEEIEAFVEPEEEAPDWLAELRVAAGMEPETTPSVEKEGVPDRQAEFEPPLVAEEPGVDVEAESWEEVKEPAEEELPAAEAEGEIPAWLAAFQAATLEEGLPPEEESLAELEGTDWLVPAQPRAEEEESLARADIPAWLMALKPPELRKEGEGPAPEAEAPLDATGILAGLQGTLAVEMIIAQPRAVTLEDTLEPPLGDTPQARLFAEVVGRLPAAAPKQVAHVPSRVRDLLPRWFIYLALLIAVLLPLLLGEAVLPHVAAPVPPTEDLYTTLEALGSGAPVLVAFDYDPSTSAEMDLLGRALVGHLMEQETRVVAISLLPAGPATAQTLLDQLAAERADYADSYGQRYANLGYLPGQATAVRILGLSLETAVPRDFYGTPVSELAVMEGLTSTQSFELVLELAAAQDTLRSWIEQAGAPYGVQVGAGVSASVEPLARPYYATEPRQLVGLVGGVAGAAAYDTLLSGEGSLSDSAAARWDALLLGALALILILLIANLVYLVQRGGRREG